MISGKKARYIKEICQVLFFSYGIKTATWIHHAHESWMAFALFVCFRSWNNKFRKRLANAEYTQSRVDSTSCSVLVYRSEELSIWENHASRNLITSYSQAFLCRQLLLCPCSQQAGWQHIQRSLQMRRSFFLAKQVCNSLFILVKSLIPESWNPDLFKIDEEPSNDFTEAGIIH